MRAVEISAVGLFFSLLAFSLGRIELEYTPIAALLGWILADLFSGLVHWALDTHGSVRTPLVGPAIIRPFREHHSEPEAMTRHDFIEVNGASCLGCVPILMATTFFSLNSFIHSILVSFCLGILLTNQCHKWAHTPSDQVNSLIKALQKLGLVLRPAEHAKHHTPPYNSHFCTANGWLNRPLNRLLG